MNRKILLEFYLNKYLVPSYILFKRIEVVNIEHMNNERINVKLLVVCDKDKFDDEFLLTGVLEDMLIIRPDNIISSIYLSSPIFKQSKNISFDKLKKEIKHYIKIIIYKRINLFEMNLKIEETLTNNHKQST
jgi:hypothetical protein